MSPLTGFKAENHPQQVLFRGARTDVNERATPAELFAALDRRFRFTVDAAALPYNRKLDRYFAPPGYVHKPDGCMWDSECRQPCPCPNGRPGPLGIDGLAQDWSGERVWVNPPFSDLEPWIRKAHESTAELVVMLLPANRTELGWWQEFVEPNRDRGGRLRCEFLPGRIRFGIGSAAPAPNTRPPFGCCLLIWGDS